MVCPNCGKTVSADSHFCLRCGCRLPADCTNCCEVNPSDSLYCRLCGRSLALAVSVVPPLEGLACPRCNAGIERNARFCCACGLSLDELGPWPTSHETAPAAGFWIRLLAWFIDSVLLLLTEIAVVAAVPGISLTRYWDGSEFTWVFNEISLLLAVCYYTMSVYLFSTTAGKRVLGLYVLRRDGSRLSFARSLCRCMAYIPSYLVLCIGFLMIGFRRDRRGLHDLICDTMVIKG